MLGISRTPLTEPGYNSISLFFFKLFLCTATVANRSALCVPGPDSDLGELYCRLELVLVIAAAAGLAGAGAACAPRERCGFPAAPCQPQECTEPRVPNRGAGSSREMLRNVLFS